MEVFFCVIFYPLLALNLAGTPLQHYVTQVNVDFSTHFQLLRFIALMFDFHLVVLVLLKTF